MPSRDPTDSRDFRTATVLVVLAVLVASMPATVAAGFATDRTDATSSGIASDRAACPGGSATTGNANSLANGTAPAANASASAANESVPSTPNESADLDVSRGDVAVVPLSVPAGANVTVEVGSGEGYSARLDVRDDGDGRVRLLVNTYLAGNRTTVAPGTYRTAGEDEVTVVGGTPTARLETGTYSVTVRRDDSVVATEQLTVTDPSFESVTAHRAVPRLFEADDAGAVRTANRSGLVGPLQPGEHEPEVVSGETLLLRIDAPSLLGAVAARSGNTTTERFLALHYDVEPETPETFEIFGPCGGILFDDTVAAGGARVLLDYREGAVYVLLDTENLSGLDAGGQSVYVEAAPESRINGGDEKAELTTEFRIGQRRTELRSNGTGVATLSADERAMVVGETNLQPGSRVPVQVESRVNATFERATTATVADDGTFAATVDLSDASTPGLFAVRVGPDQFPAEIGDPPSVHWNLRQIRATDPVTEFSLERLTLPGGGVLVAYRYDSRADRFRPVGSSVAVDDDFTVDPLSEPQHLVVVAHRDANGNGVFDPGTDPPYRVDGRIVHGWLAVEVDGVGPSGDSPPTRFDADRVATESDNAATTSRDAAASESTAGTTATDSTTTSASTAATAATTTADTTPSSTSTSDSTTPATDAGLPGFGPLVVVFALVASLALAATRSLGRRRE